MMTANSVPMITMRGMLSTKSSSSSEDSTHNAPMSNGRTCRAGETSAESAGGTDSVAEKLASRGVSRSAMMTARIRTYGITRTGRLDCPGGGVSDANWLLIPQKTVCGS